MSFLGFDDVASLKLFSDALKDLRDEKKISESYSWINGGWSIAEGDDVYLLGHCDGKSILGMSGKEMAADLVKFS